MSGKRSRMLAVATAGTLTATAAISAATILTAPAAAAAGPDDARLTSAQSAAPAAAPGAVQHGLFIKMRSVEVGREQQLAVANAAAATHKATATASAAKAADTAKAAKAAAQQKKAAVTPSGTPRQIAKQMLTEFGWSPSQFSYLDSLWWHESGWSPTAENPSSGAFGIPQALPAAQMASAGADWQTNPATQIKWGLTYIQQRYGSPSGAWAHEEDHNWY